LSSSRRAKTALAVLVSGYLGIAVVAGAPRSPLTVLLPAGVSAPTWASRLARAFGLTTVGRSWLIGVSWLLVSVVLLLFAVVVYEAWSRRVRLQTVLVATAVSLAISVAAPLLLSHDVLTYAAYGRVESVYGHNPYVAKLSSFPHDLFVAVTPGQWLHTHSVYGPAFTLVSAGITRWFVASPAATIFAFKLLAGLAIAAATGLVALTALRTRPDRAALGPALVGLNPVIVVHTVGGGHVDALIAAPLLAATAIAVTHPQAASAKAFAITTLLTLACLIKAVIVPVLALWLWWIVRGERPGRRRILAAHAVVIVGLTAASLSPYLAGWHTFGPFATLGGVEAWASPSHLVGSGLQAIVGSSDAAHAVQSAFLLLFVVLLWRLAARGAPLSDLWGVGLLLLALSMPFLLPWYAAWFAPFLGLLSDDALVIAGAFVTGVLALTLIPADPFYGRTSPAVMSGVHYGAASALLVVFVFVTVRVLGAGNVLATRAARARVTAA
jgi:alpha-1,6-mannosyltransferase